MASADLLIEFQKAFAAAEDAFERARKKPTLEACEGVVARYEDALRAWPERKVPAKELVFDLKHPERVIRDPGAAELPMCIAPAEVPTLIAQSVVGLGDLREKLPEPARKQLATKLRPWADRCASSSDVFAQLTGIRELGLQLLDGGAADSEIASLRDRARTVRDATMESNMHHPIEPVLVRALLRVGPREEAYALLDSAASRFDKKSFGRLFADPGYVAWRDELKRSKKQVAKTAHTQKRAEERLVGKLVDTALKALPKGTFCDAPFVRKHARTLAALRKEVAALRVERAAADDPSLDASSATAAASTRGKRRTPEELVAFEKRHQLRLPDEYKALLCELGELEGELFEHGAPLSLPKSAKVLQPAKKPFPLTKKNVHAAVWSGRSSKAGKAKLEALERSDFEGVDELYDLPKGARFGDGALLLGSSVLQGSVYLVMNGEFAGQVWTFSGDTEATLPFTIATPKPMLLLDYLVANVRIARRGYDGEVAHWL